MKAIKKLIRKIRILKWLRKNEFNLNKGVGVY